MRQFEQVVQMTRDSSEIRLRLSVALQMLGRWQSSTEHCLKGLQLDEANADLWNNLGVAYAKMKQTDKAIEAFYNSTRRRSQFVKSLDESRERVFRRQAI